MNKYRGAIQLVIVGAIIIVALGLLLPAVQKVPDDSARSSSTNNLKQIGLAMQSYNDTIGHLPYNGGHTDPDKLKEINFGWHNPNVRDSGTWATQIAPFMEADAVSRNNKIEATAINDMPKWFVTAANNVFWHVRIKNYNCPGRGRDGFKTNTAVGNYPGVVTDYALNLFINDPPKNYNEHGFAINGGLAVAGNSKVVLDKIPDGAANTILIGGKALPPTRFMNNQARDGDEGIFSPGHYVVESDKVTVHSSGTGRGHSPNAKGVPWMYSDAELNGQMLIDAREHWGGPFSGGVLFTMADGTVRSIKYDVRGTVNFARMLYPGDGIEVKFD